MNMNEWRHKDEWKRGGKDFLIVVSRHEESEDFERGKHRWCIYAYLYPAHPHFAAFNETEEMWQEPATMMPLHGGPSLLRRHISNEGRLTSIQVGCDYDHLHDRHYTHFATAEMAGSVFRDADNLFNWLSERATP